MTLSSTSLGTGRVVAAEKDAAIWPTRKFQVGTLRGVLHCHQGQTDGWESVDFTNTPGTGALMNAIAAAGYAVACSDLGGLSTIGNTTGQTRVGQLDTWVKSSTGAGASSATRVVVGISGGATGAVNYFGYDAATTTGHVSDLAALVLILPALNLDFYYQNDTGGLRAQIETAWGITYPTALPAHADPQTNMTLIAASTIPTRIYVAGSSGDPIQTKAMADANLTALGGNGTVIELSGTTHSDATIAGIDKPDLIAWLHSVAA